nr:BTAD domain-containing putative transcriptional regulator [Streptomyces scabichelini]
MDIHMLGPVELCRDQRSVVLGSPKESLLLVALAFDAGRPVALDSLIHRLWDDAPPARPRASLHSYVARIRRRLRDLDVGECLVQRAHAYTLDVRPDQVDYHRFRQLAAQARSLTDDGQDSQALDLLGDATALWRGEPLAGLPGLWAETLREVLSEKRLAAELTRIGIELRRGHFAEVAADVPALLEQHPTDETLAGQLMTAAYGSGRQADALRIYGAVRRRLREDLGTDPGEPLQRVHSLVLHGAPVQELVPRPEPAVAAPRTLPSHAELVGRREELATISRRASAWSTAPSSLGTVIALQAVSGMAGIGKTLIALHAARSLGPEFPDGQLYLDLRAHSPGQEPLTAQAALTSLLRVLGVPATTLPDHLDGLVGLWRTLLSTRRAIIVLDDAVGPEQLRPLLPGASPSLVIVTSRRRITGLPGVQSIQLDVLPPEDAIALFRKVAGEDRTRQTNEVAEIVRLSGYLPLAVELAAGRLLSRPAWTTAHLLQKLIPGRSRLTELRDGSREIARAFEISYQTLTSEERTVFRTLGLRLGPDFDAFTIAALGDLTVGSAERFLDALLDAHLIQEPTPERYTVHDLLGEYSRTLAAVEDSEADREAAVHRLVDFYIQASDAADRLLHPRRLRPEVPHPSPRPVPAWPDAQAARRWLATERAGLLAAESHCRTNGRPHEAALLAGTLADFLDEEGHWTEARYMHEAAAHHWSTVGEQQAEVYALIDLGTALSHCGRYREADAAHRRALKGAQDIGDTEARAEALHRLGVLHWNAGQLSEALAHQQETLALRLLSGDVWQIARSRNNLGITHLYLGNLESARENFDAALTGFHASGDMREAAHVLNNLSDLHLRTGNTQYARILLQEALDVLTDCGSPADLAITRINLAGSMTSPSELNEMLDLYRDSLTTFRRLGDRRNAAITQHGMGLALHAAGRFHDAAAHHRRALDLAASIGAAHEEAQALHGLGASEHRLGQSDSAARHIAAAIEIADRIGAAGEAAQARDSLAALEAEAAGADRKRGYYT